MLNSVMIEGIVERIGLSDKQLFIDIGIKNKKDKKEKFTIRCYVSCSKPNIGDYVRVTGYLIGISEIEAICLFRFTGNGDLERL